MKAKKRNRPVSDIDVAHIAEAVSMLRNARDVLRAREANNAANYVARALKSAQGALSNAQRMLAKQEREKAKCRNCGKERAYSGDDAKCAKCGHLFTGEGK